MVFIALKTMISNLAVVQSKLSDFMDGKPDVSKFIENALIKEKKIIPQNKNIQMLEDKYFEMIVPICYHCEKQKNAKAGWTYNKLTLDNGEKVEIDLQLYYCHDCNFKLFTKFNEERSGELDDNEIEIVNELENNENKNFNKTIKDKVRDFVSNTSVSLRKTAWTVENFLDLDLSHQ
jgi:hypothetical protein